MATTKTVHTMEDYRKALAEFAAEVAQLPRIVEGETKAAMQQAMFQLVGKLAQYPPPPSGSSYRRTGTLGRLWVAGIHSMEIRDHPLYMRVGNATPYGAYVQDPDEQAAIHRGRWQTTEDVVTENMGLIEKLFEEAGYEGIEQVIQRGMA